MTIEGFFRIISPRLGSTFRAYTETLLGTMSWRVPLSAALMLLGSTVQGAQLLLLVPLMELVGLDVQQGSVGRLAQSVGSAFEFVGIPLTLASVLGAFVLFTTMLSLLNRWQTIYNFTLVQQFVAILRQRLYRAIASTDWLTFSRIRSSDLTHALTNELERVGEATTALLRLVTTALLLLVYMAFALRLSATMCAMVFITGLALVLVLRRRTTRAHWLGGEISMALNDLYSASIEHLSGMKTVKSYGVEDRNTKIFTNLTEQVAKVLTWNVRNTTGTTFWFTVGSAVILSVILYVSVEVIGMTAAGLLLLLFLFNRMIPLFNGLQGYYQMYLNQMPAFAGVMELQSRCEAAAEPMVEPAEAVEFLEGIRFEGVSFSYGGEGSSDAIQDFDLAIEMGKTTAIVGPSGAGKSTIADLVMGLIVPTRGTVLVDEVVLGPEQIRSWRRQIGYVAQDTFLLNDTVEANLLWARPEASEEEIWEVLRLAAADGFVAELPDGLATVLGDRGVRLSGGERQRLALARALLRRPSLLILDEATSALDSENEKRIQSAIEGLHGRTTILIITHRLSTIRGADVIYVLERGRLVESGSWEELIEKHGGRFAALANAQDIGQDAKQIR